MQFHEKKKITPGPELMFFFCYIPLDAYVWIYDPTPWYYWVGGTAIVLVTIAVCLFPLWPPWMRLGKFISFG